ncbi:uncharacterized protein CTRU02_207066 [Colletotrichum truncatum]|uniref:Uncharacterized protein n=1 Tax=Colletotrichum truncatum TaxID=5467 RepID=A0ACC3YZH4_COLTU|nr:uncharacterized protein CTRU02_11071 [Colletotrichum truncatum]KAF6786200.1 hypothetical protein CTRU02_11071 [Colletotrichum truncatum]
MYLKALITFVPLVASAILSPRQAAPTEIYRFQNGWIENLATHSNGALLVTRMDQPDLWSVNPSSKTATKLYTFPDAYATGGLVEMSPNIWAVITGKYRSGTNTPGSWGIWKVDLTGPTAKASVVKVVPESKLFNGLAKFEHDKTNNTLLIGDAAAGAVYKMNFSTGAYSILLADKSMNPQGFLPFGIDGMKFFNGSLYFTNIGQNTFNRLPIDTAGKPGSVSTIFNNSPGDDFIFDAAGNAYIATNTQNSVIKVDPAGKVTKLATVQGSTSTTLGRAEKDGNVLYIGSSQGTISAITVK